MSDPTTPTAVETEREQETEATGRGEAETPQDALVDEELLVEDVSIDGMCGVY